MKFIKSNTSEITASTTSANSALKASKAKTSHSILKDFSNSFVSIQLEKVNYIRIKSEILF